MHNTIRDAKTISGVLWLSQNWDHIKPRLR
jgi:hypothetical protein